MLLASGTCGYGAELAPFVALDELGGIVAKSLTLEPRAGNVPPRITETPAGMLNAISLENVGVEAFLRDKLPALPPALTVVASVFETELERYAEVCKRLDGGRARRGARAERELPAREGGRDRVRPGPARARAAGARLPRARRPSRCS